MLKISGGDEKSPEKEKEKEKKKEHSGGSIKKRLSIGYGFSSLRKRNPIKGVFEEDDKKKGKSIEIKVDDVGWKQTKHVGQEEAQQLKALMALTRQLGEEDTDDIVKLLEEWDKDKVQKEIEDKRRMQMQKNRSLQVVMEQWNLDPGRDAPQPASDNPAFTWLSASGRSTPTNESTSTTKAAPTVAASNPVHGSGDEQRRVEAVTNGVKENNEKDRETPQKGNESAETAKKKKKKTSEGTKMMTMIKEEEEEENGEEDVDGGTRRGGRGGRCEEDEFTSTNDDSMDEFTGDSTIIDDDDEELMEVAEIGSDEGSEGGRSPRSSFMDKTPNNKKKSKNKKKAIREPRPPSMVFGKKENLDLRDWQTFLEAERARALPYVVASPRRTASPRNSPAGFLIFKQKKMLSLNSPSPSSSKLTNSSSGESSAVSSSTENNGGGRPRSWSDDDGEGARMTASHRAALMSGGDGEEVIELSEMSDGEEEEEEEGEEDTDARRASKTSTPKMPPLAIVASATASSKEPTSTASTPKSSGPSTPTIPRIVLSSQPSPERTVRLPPASPSHSPRRARDNSGALLATDPSRKEQMRRISLSDSQLIFFQRWMRDTVKDGKVEVPADVEQEIKDREREAVKIYEKMEVDALRKALIKRDKEVAVLKRAVEDLKKREEKAAAREKELREEVRRERERADRVQQRETVLKELIREKVEEKRKMKEERDKERHKEEEKEKRKEKKEKKKSDKHEKKRKGSAIKFVSKEKEKEREKERERSRSSREKEREREKDKDEELVGSGGSKQLERGAQEELASLQEMVKGGTWSKSRGREVKIFKHLRSKSSEEVPTAFVAKDTRGERGDAPATSTPKA